MGEIIEFPADEEPDVSDHTILIKKIILSGDGRVYTDAAFDTEVYTAREAQRLIFQWVIMTCNQFLEEDTDPTVV